MYVGKSGQGVPFWLKDGGSREIMMDDGGNHGIWRRQIGDIEHQNMTMVLFELTHPCLHSSTSQYHGEGQ